jgi:hypothetical protein
MPTVAGTPVNVGGMAAGLANLPGSILDPIDWIDAASPTGVGGAVQSALMRGTPGAQTWWQKRSPRGPDTMAQGWPVYLQSRGYSRGAGAYAPKFGLLATNPIGAGIYAPYKLPVIAGPGARYQFGAIWFDVQAIPTTIRMSPTMPAESVNALLATSTVAAMYATTG